MPNMRASKKPLRLPGNSKGKPKNQNIRKENKIQEMDNNNQRTRKR